MECRVKETSIATWLEIQGRIDGMTSPDIQREMDGLILRGVQWLIVDLEKVSYISSAGLRVFLSGLKQLKKIDGTLMLYKPSPNVLEVLKITGFGKLFPVADSTDQIDRLLGTTKRADAVSAKEVDGLKMTFAEKGDSISHLSLIGSLDKTGRAAYTEEDVVAVEARKMPFGIGLAAMGSAYSDFKDYFGESIVIKNSLFTYPAVKQPAVDFMLCADEKAETTYRFLHGFGFGNNHRYDVSIDAEDRLLRLDKMVDGLFTLSKSNLLGIVFLAQSKGLWGMHLKRVPTLENRPENGRSIFDPENFSQWMDFPIEPEDIDHILIGVGIALRNRKKASPALSKLIPEGDSFHIHAAVFSKGPLGNQLQQFDDELHRVMTETDAIKVQHLLGKSRLGNPLVRIFELKE